jgi:predicted PurR-regulated permease PerM
VADPQDPKHVVALRWTVTAILAYLAFEVVRPFLAPLGWASIIVIVFYPVHARLGRRFGPSRAALLTTLLVAFVVIVPLAIVATAFVNEALDAIRGLQEAAARGEFEWIEAAFRRWLRRVPVGNRPDLTSAVLGATQRGAVIVGAYSGSVLRNVAVFVFDLIVVLFSTFFLFRDAPSVVSTIRDVLPLDEGARDRLLRETADVINVSVRSSVAVAGLQGLLGGLLFAAVGIQAPVFWGVVMAFFCLLPLGAWLVWLPAAVVLAVAGDFWRALVVAGVGFGVVSAVDNVLRPMLLSGRTRMNGLLVFVSLLGGVAAFGALGLVLGPVVLATAMSVITVYTESRRQSAGAERTL